MKRFILVVLTLVIFFVSAAGTQAAEYTQPIYSRSAYFVNLNTGRVLFEKEADTRMAPASLTKMMTVLLAIEMCDDPENTMVTIPSQSLFTDVIVENGARIYLQEGEQISVQSLIYATMIKSACDSATALAWYFGDGDVNQFFDLMNQKAQSLGMVNTHFANAHGLDAEDHYSTARDMAILTQAALKNETFRDVISNVSYVLPATNKSAQRTVSYTIGMLDPDDKEDYYPDAFGVKSGYTGNAGRCLSTTATRDGQTYLCVVLGANLDQPPAGYGNPNLTYADSKALYEWAFETYAQTEAVPDDFSQEVAVVHGKAKTVAAMMQTVSQVLVAPDETLTYTYQMNESVEAPVKAGETVLGTMNVLRDGEVIDEVTLVAKESVEALPYPKWLSGFAWFGIHPLWIILLLLLLIMIVGLYLRYRYVQSVKRKRAARRARRRKTAAAHRL